MSLLKTIQGQLLASVLLLSGVAVGIGIFEFSKITELKNRTDLVAGVIAERSKLTSDAEIQLLDYVRAQKNVLLSQDENARRNSETRQQEVLARFNSDVTEWEGIATDAGRQDLETVRSGMIDYQRLNQQILGLAHSGDVAGATALTFGQSIPIFNQIWKALDSSKERAADVMAKQREETAALYRTVCWSVWTVMILGVGAGLATSWYVVRQTVERLHRVRDFVRDVAEGEGDLTQRLKIVHRDELGEVGHWLNKFLAGLEEIIGRVALTSGEIAASTVQIAGSATQIAQSSEKQSRETAQVTTAMREMSASVLEVSRHSEEASTAAQQAGEMARGGGRTVDATVAIMREIAESTRESAETVQLLGKSSDEIGRIIAVIKDIADQTGLLALNAAIEAARAGEQGRGFAVVAGEVRNLAERTTKATKEIETMISGVQETTRRAVTAMDGSTRNVDRGLEIAQECTSALNQITASAQSLEEMITQIAAAATEQSSSANQVNGNMDAIAGMVQNSAASAQESANACQGLSSMSQDMQKLVSRFKVGDGQQSSEARPADRGRAGFGGANPAFARG